MQPEHVGSVFAFCKALTSFYDKFTPKQLAMLLLIAEAGEQGISQLTFPNALTSLPVASAVQSTSFSMRAQAVRMQEEIATSPSPWGW